MKKIAALTSLALVLAACGSTTPQGSQTTTPTPAPAFTVDGKSGFRVQRITVPKAVKQPASASSARLKPLATTPWTGPMNFQEDKTYLLEPQVNSKGELFIPGEWYTDGLGDSTSLQKYDRSGNLIGYNEVFDNRLDHVAVRLIVPRNNEAQNAFQFFENRTNFPHKEYAYAFDNNVKQIEINGDTNFYASYLRPVSVPLQYFPSEKGYYALDNSTQGKFDLFEMAFQNWGSIEPNNIYTIRPPSQYADKQSLTYVVPAPDGGAYLAVFTPFSCLNIYNCQYIGGVTKFKDGDVEWQTYWDYNDLVRLDGFFVNENGIYIPAKNYADLNSPQNEYLKLSLSGDLIGNFVMPVDLPADNNTNSSYVQILPGDRIARTSSMDGGVRILETGTLTQGITATRTISSFDGAYFNVANLIFEGDNIYVGGSFAGTAPANNYKKAVDHHPDWPYGYYLFPLDFNLNPRW